MSQHAKLYFAPRIWITAEHAAEVLDVPIDKADQLLSRPDTNEILMAALHQAFNETVDRTLKEMLRVPHETVPTRIDCAVTLPTLPVAKIFQ